MQRPGGGTALIFALVVGVMPMSVDGNYAAGEGARATC